MMSPAWLRSKKLTGRSSSLWNTSERSFWAVSRPMRIMPKFTAKVTMEEPRQQASMAQAHRYTRPKSTRPFPAAAAPMAVPASLGPSRDRTLPPRDRTRITARAARRPMRQSSRRRRVPLASLGFSVFSLSRATGTVPPFPAMSGLA